LAVKAIVKRELTQRTAFSLLVLATAIVAIPVLFIIAYIVVNGAGAISWEFLTQPPSQAGKAGGIFPAIVGTFYLMLGTLLFALPVGVLASVYLTEYARDNWLTRLINMAILNLAGVPSIVYGLFGLGLFVMAMKFGMSLLAASLTLACQALAMTITTSREAIIAVPREYREGSLAIGATRWQTIRHVVLPQALPGIITGAILAMSRAMGEAAPLLVIGIPVFIANTPDNLNDNFTVLPFQIFNWAGRPQESFHQLAASAIVVLLIALICFNGVAVYLRQKLRNPLA